MSLLNHQLIITINRRLARELTKQYSASQIASGKQVWESPRIIPWTSWLNILWQQDLDQTSEKPVLLLNNIQSRVIWEGIIRYSSAADGLLQVGETTRVAMEAWRLLHDHDLQFDQIKNLLTEHNLDTQAFCEWAGAYQDRLKYKHWIDPETLSVKLIERFESESLGIPDQLLLAGFDELTPVQQRLLNLLVAKGCRIETYQSEQRSSNAIRLSCTDSDHELQLVASRVRFLLEQNSESRIGVVVPDLHKRKAQIEAVFEDILVPEAILPGSLQALESLQPFNISLGDPLTSFAVIKTAFLILTSATGRLPLEDLSRLIRSPFIAGGEFEMAQRSLLDAQLRQYGDDSLGLSLVIKEASCEEEIWHSPVLSEILHKTHDLIEEIELSNKRTIVEWLKLFDEILESMGWPDRSLSSEEFQTLESWRSVREQCVALETVTREMTYTTALQHLRKIASDQTFQPETIADVPIQIMGMLEATGLQFDHLLVLGMTDDLWPGKPSPNPFLPLKLQRDKKMPHATAEAELIFARKMTSRLLQSAPEIIFSYPMQEADQELRPSPLIKIFPEKSDLEISQVPDYRQHALLQTTLERLADNHARQLPENVLWKGGTGIFKDQAACPFRAFVRHRLKAQPLGIAEPGLNPAERGSLVHDALEILWGKLETQEKLKQLSPDQVKKEIRDSVETALKDFHSGKSVIREAQFQTLEIDRLEKLLSEWLDVERAREPFTVAAREQDMKLTLGGISVKTRVDRIDKLDGGELALIDYKTGDVSIKSWESDRPDEPQLPLYAVSMKETPEAVLFAKVKKGDQNFTGLSNDLDIGKSHEDWDQLIADWRGRLEDLAGQFVRGEALVDPKDNTTCQYCTYQSLCRIDEVVSQLEMDNIDDCS